MLSLIFRLFLCLIVAAFISFVAVNFLVGCSSWDDGSCITPLEMIGW